MPDKGIIVSSSGRDTVIPSVSENLAGLVPANWLGLKAPSYSKTALPTQLEGGIIYVTDDVGGAVIAFSDGTNWRRVTDRAIIA